jgi:peptidyl-tRNA hydrolase
MSNTKQVILIRKDLNLPVGLLAAQACHIHFELIRNNLKVGGKGTYVSEADMHNWLEAPYLYIHGVPHLEALNYYKQKAIEAKLPVAIWEDTIYQELAEDLRIPFNMTVGISIGPCDSDSIKLIIGTLPLL